MTPAEVGGITRTIMAALGGYAVAKGWLDASTATAISGAMVTLAAALWSIRAKRA